VRRFMTLALLAALLQSAPGCAYFAHNPKLVSQSQEHLVNADLPVPAGFAIDTSKSASHERSGYRRLTLVYRNLEYLSEERTREFVQETYASAGWTLDFVYGFETSKFVFHKGAEECRVEIFENFGDRYTEIHVEVEPRKTPDGGLVGRRITATGETNTPATVKASSSK
jgi:hypothetical protein